MSDPIATSTILPQAFRFMEVTPPSSFDDESERAGAAKEQYSKALGMALEAYDWSFARRVANLALAEPRDGEIADPDLPYTYNLPADCASLRHIYEGHCFTWRIDQRMVRADRNAGITIRYTASNIREKTLPATFLTAVSLQLAVLLSNRFAKTRAKRKELKEDLRELYASAEINDRHTASIARLDGQPAMVDWVREAVQR